MEPERRRTARVVVDGDGGNALLKGSLRAAVRDISAGGLGLGLPARLDPGGVYPLMALLRGLSLATPVRITRCEPGRPGADGEKAWEAGAEFLFRDDGDAVVVRRWLEGRETAAK